MKITSQAAIVKLLIVLGIASAAALLAQPTHAEPKVAPAAAAMAHPEGSNPSPSGNKAPGPSVKEPALGRNFLHDVGDFFDNLFRDKSRDRCLFSPVC